MKVFIINRADAYLYLEDYRDVVVAKDKIHAERFARLKISDLKKQNLK